jgi:hypothetical protein
MHGGGSGGPSLKGRRGESRCPQVLCRRGIGESDPAPTADVRKGVNCRDLQLSEERQLYPSKLTSDAAIISFQIAQPMFPDGPMVMNWTSVPGLKTVIVTVRDQNTLSR